MFSEHAAFLKGDCHEPTTFRSKERAMPMPKEELAAVRDLWEQFKGGKLRLELAVRCAQHLPILLAEVERLRQLNEALAERIAAQSELLSRRAEREVQAPAP